VCVLKQEGRGVYFTLVFITKIIYISYSMNLKSKYFYYNNSHRREWFWVEYDVQIQTNLD